MCKKEEKIMKMKDGISLMLLALVLVGVVIGVMLTKGCEVVSDYDIHISKKHDAGVSK
jgi:hypothetical protein